MRPSIGSFSTSLVVKRAIGRRCFPSFDKDGLRCHTMAKCSGELVGGNSTKLSLLHNSPVMHGFSGGWRGGKNLLGSRARCLWPAKVPDDEVMAENGEEESHFAGWISTSASETGGDARRLVDWILVAGE